ncbi:hypothetical protein DFP72DRAFT_1134970 [Ephemerocybe angulata]|uniref:F-box domain-containing protein n=1 Tax=Ephemerocybe angulata TaxID=980116 RepID=A0A8H6HRE3_9AGAR|nr:hypothetical protein DFP72DRAFT_1134970 [Tulosesus angulatus]
MIGLSDLSTELHLKIAEALEPVDLVSFAQTCSAVHKPLMSTRSAWEASLRVMCERRRISEYTLRVPFSEMDLDELRFNCWEWDRMMSHLGRSGAMLKPRGLQVLDDGVFGATNYSTDTAFLIPGGRYVVSKSGDEVIKLWDLGPTWPAREAGSRMRLIDSCPLRPNHQSVSSLSVPVQGTNSVSFAASIDGNNGPVICLYEVGPLQEECRLRLLGELEFPLSDETDVIVDMGITSDLVYVLYDAVVLAWDCRRSLITSWKTPGYGGLDKTVVSNGIGVAVTQSSVCGWELPEFRPLSPNFVAEGMEAARSDGTLPLLFDLPLPDGIGEHLDPMIVDVAEEKNLLQITFDVAKKHATRRGASRKFNINRFVFRSHFNSSFMLTWHTESFEIPKRDEESNLTYLHNSRSPGSPVVLEEPSWTRRLRHRFMHSTALERSDHTQFASVSVPIDTTGDFGCYIAQICPFSGRMLTICDEVTEGTTYARAYVLDFYAPTRD